ncbi:MAG: Carbohydrate kinase, FGGY-like [Anaerocolumna sp.]|nr:Carbohydrate kinase, FGGY-like [Anaerocolumna sp.]
MLFLKNVLAFDIGASSGRAILGTFDGDTINTKEIHRFLNEPVTVNGTMYWDVLRLFHELKQGLIKAKLEGEVDSIGIDTWGVDFGLIDKKGYLLENPIHYRDNRTEGMFMEAFKRLPKSEFYNITGNQFMEINTAFQLLSLNINRPELLERAETLLLMPDLLNYLFTGVKTSEYSIASTTQLLDASKRIWSKEVMDSLKLPQDLFTPIVPSGTKIGSITKEICEELNVSNCEVIAVAGHDTQSALVSVPTDKEDFIFISCGTWSLMGTELNEPYINEKSDYYNITNEGGYGGKISFLKNITGLWLIQESRRWWIKEGKEYSFSTLEEMAQDAKPFQCFIDPDAPEFGAAGNMPGRIREYCNRTGQYVPNTIGEIVRCINESLAFKYRLVLEEVINCTGKVYSNVHMVGGGIQSKLLCQLTANACGRNVIAGPVEATVFGNLALQLIALGEIKDLEEARKVIKGSAEIIQYRPELSQENEEAFVRYKKVIQGTINI